jgi:predicted kinase
MDEAKLAARVALHHVTAGSLEDVSKLRFQAVFLMGAGGSGKGYVGRKWMKYMPGGGSTGIDFDKQKELGERRLTEMQRGQTNLNFEKARAALAEKFNIRITPVGGGARIPFILHTYNSKGQETVLPEKEWKKELPDYIYDQVQGLKEVVFGAPKYEIPSFWRQINPDIYKEELEGYSEKQPGYVHEMSSSMAKAYFEAAIETGDPLFIDGTGTNPEKMANYLDEAKKAGYRTSLVFVAVPLVVNQIRNSTRSRNVNPNIVTGQWRKIPAVYDQIKGMADKAKVIVNRADSMDVKTYRSRASDINEFIATNTSFDSLYDLIKKEAPNELRDWGKILKLHAGEMERERRFTRVEEKRMKMWLRDNPGKTEKDWKREQGRQYVMAKELRAALRTFQAHVDKTAAIVTVKDKCNFTLSIDKIIPYGKPQGVGGGDVDYHYHLLGRVDHRPTMVPIKFKVHVIVSQDESGSVDLVVIHTDRSGKVVPKIMSDYVKALLRQYRGSWMGSLPLDR